MKYNVSEYKYAGEAIIDIVIDFDRFIAFLFAIVSVIFVIIIIDGYNYIFVD